MALSFPPRIPKFSFLLSTTKCNWIHFVLSDMKLSEEHEELALGRLDSRARKPVFGLLLETLKNRFHRSPQAISSYHLLYLLWGTHPHKGKGLGSNGP